MSGNFEKVKTYLSELGLDVTSEDSKEELVIINDETRGIVNLLIDCNEPILVLEQFIFALKRENQQMYKRLLQMNREVVHGAFAIDEEGKSVIYRDTLQLKNLDKNELEGSIMGLSLALAENYQELIEFSK